VNQVDVSDEARDDLLAIANYLSDFSIPAANRFIDSFETVLADLRLFARIGSAEGSDENRRVLYRGFHAFLYEIGEERLTVIRILDARRPRQ
jgi:plasmid stabilization system protein ParE